ncbi:MAG TPA: DUF3352 domain-containing protein, partial [Planctomycetota bacterium]|nr:DUF3352 domain-containing protein [Planctomycetota bacterium]
FLPRHTIAAIRIPSVAALKKAVTESGLLRPFLGDAAARLDGASLAGMISAVLEKEGVQDRALQSLVEEVAYLDGELVLAVLVEPPATPAMEAHGPRESVAVALFADLGARAEAVKKKVDAVAPRLATLPGDVSIDLAVKHGVLGLVSSGPEFDKGQLARWMSQEKGVSFLASPVAKGAPRIPDGARETRFEVLVDLGAFWPWMTSMSAASRAYVAANGIDKIQGLSYVLGATETGGFAETLTMHGESANLVTKLLAAAALDKAFARWTPKDAESASLASLDFGRMLADVRATLTPGDRSALDAELSTLKKRSGIDLRADLLDAIGPSFLVATRGTYVDLRRRGLGDFDALLACELRDPERVRNVVEKVLAQTPLANMRTREKFAGGDISVFELPPLPEAAGRASLRPSFAFADRCLLVASSPEALRGVLDAPKGEATGLQATLRKSIGDAPAGTFLVSASDAKAEQRRIEMIATAFTAMRATSKTTAAPKKDDAAALADTIVTARCENGSVIVASRSDAYPALTIGSFAPLATVSAIAIPSLLKARLSANEAAAQAMLRSIAAAEKSVRDAGDLDADHDGIGEYAYIAELNGWVPLRGTGERLDPPALYPSGKMTDGCLVKSGYCFRLDLCGRDGEPLPEADGGGARGALAADAGESGFVAYAWPASESSGLRAFVIDESGVLWESDNRGNRQGYCGLERAPRGDAAYLTEGSNRGVGSGLVRLGRDGALWKRVQR